MSAEYCTCGHRLATHHSGCGCLDGICPCMKVYPTSKLSDPPTSDLLPGLRYAVNRLRDRGQLYDAAAIENDIAMMEAGKTPPFFEEEG